MLKILNFRSLAKNTVNHDGKKIIPNTIFRSGTLSYASKLDIRRLKSLGIKDVYDFRNSAETSSMATLSDRQIKTHSFDILGDIAQADAKTYLDKTRRELDQGVINLYSGDFVSTDKYRDVLATILQQDNPEFLFHCTAGKDRTGIFAAILMMILDFDIETIKKEYLTLSKFAIHIMRKHMLKKTGVKSKDVDLSKFKGILGVFPEYIDSYFESISKNYSNIDEYLYEKVGVTPEIKAALKERYLVSR